MSEFSLDDLHHRMCKEHYEECCKQLFCDGKIAWWTSGDHHQDEKRCVICTQEKIEKLESVQE